MIWIEPTEGKLWTSLNLVFLTRLEADLRARFNQEEHLFERAEIILRPSQPHNVTLDVAVKHYDGKFYVVRFSYLTQRMGGLKIRIAAYVTTIMEMRRKHMSINSTFLAKETSGSSFSFHPEDEINEEGVIKIAQAIAECTWPFLTGKAPGTLFILSDNHSNVHQSQ